MAVLSPSPSLRPQLRGGTEPKAAMRRRPITPHEKQVWSEMAQLLMLAGLAESSRWEARDIVFHGGTSLHLGWASPRFSEDLDFLLNKDLLGEMSKTMVEVIRRMESYMLRLDAGLRIELADKSTSRMGRFNISIYKEGVIGKAMVKSEFWGVDDSYLNRYKAEPKTPIMPAAMDAEGMLVRLRAQLPIATLDSVFCDKLVAMAGRPYTKWRDIFDMWWISQSREFKRPADSVIAERVKFYASAYRTDPNSSDTHDAPPDSNAAPNGHIESLSTRLRAYAERISQPEMLGAAKEELARFLQDYMGLDRCFNWADNVQEMIDNAAFTARHVADLLDHQQHQALEYEDLDEPYTPQRMRATW